MTLTYRGPIHGNEMLRNAFLQHRPCSNDGGRMLPLNSGCSVFNHMQWSAKRPSLCWPTLSTMCTVNLGRLVPLSTGINLILSEKFL